MSKRAFNFLAVATFFIATLATLGLVNRQKTAKSNQLVPSNDKEKVPEATFV
jgi:hypothetical protein